VRESGAAGIGVAGKPATFTQASEGSGVTINFCAACGTKLYLDLKL
jgi:hypothetical protein